MLSLLSTQRKMTDTSTERAIKKLKTTDGDAEQQQPKTIKYVEFYSGVGGWTMALEQAWHRRVHEEGKDNNGRKKLHRIAAFDNSDLCTKVFQHNFGSDDNKQQQKTKTFNIERLTLKQVEAWKANIWAMSPPCQPHTRQHSNQSNDLNDPRSKSFLHLCGLLAKMNESSLPSLLLLENVIGFELSNSFQRFQHILNTRNYRTSHFHLSPTQVGIPNDRPRHFCVAVLSSRLKQPESNDDDSSSITSLLSYLKERPTIDFPSSEKNDSQQLTINKELPEMGIVPLPAQSAEPEQEKLPTIAPFLDDTKSSKGSLRVPEKILSKNAAWCFDVVTPTSKRSACFTSSYGKFIKGTGSILYEDEDNNGKFQLEAPDQREFEKDWTKSIHTAKLRYFSGMEMARLMGYSSSFSFPSDTSTKQQWKLIGNSLNVRIASLLAEFGLELIHIDDEGSIDEEKND